MYITLNVLMPILIYIYCEGQMKQKVIKLCLRVRYQQHVIGTSVVLAHHIYIIFLSTYCRVMLLCQLWIWSI